MKRKRFTEAQLIGVLREHEAGTKAGDLARKHGVREATLYNWKAKYGGMDVSDAKRLKALEPKTAEANSKLDKTWGQGHRDNSPPASSMGARNMGGSPCHH